jgi:hypothetical protein
MAEEGAPWTDDIEVCPITKRINIHLMLRYSRQTVTFQVNVNLLKHSDVPHVLGLFPKPAVVIPRSERVPWINTEIIITGNGHSKKGYRGIIKDILCNQPTPSGL